MKLYSKIAFSLLLLVAVCGQTTNKEAADFKTSGADGAMNPNQFRLNTLEHMKKHLQLIKAEQELAQTKQQGNLKPQEPQEIKKNQAAVPPSPPLLQYTRLKFKPKAEDTTVYYCGPSTMRQNRKPPVQPPGPPLNDSRMKLVSTLYNFSMYVDPEDKTVSLWIDSNGTREAEFINLIGNIVRQGNSVINLGSQTGLQALVMGKVIGPTGHLYIFEPYSVSHKIVSKNVEINGMSNYTTIYNYGAGDEKTEAIIEVWRSNSGGSEIMKTPTPMVNFDEVEAVQIDKVDSLLPPDAKLDFALIDVEKMEVPALRGMMEVIKRSPNLILMVEWQYAGNPRRNYQQTMQLLKFLKQQGYKFYQYRGFSPYSCQIGHFYEYLRFEDLLNIKFKDVFFIPQNHHLLIK